MKKWCYNAKTGEIFSYNVEGDLTDFPRGVLLAYGDYLTTGLDSLEEAEKLRAQPPEVRTLTQDIL